MKLPDRCGVESMKTAKLERAIYGLKPSGRKWKHLCAETLIAEGFQECKADPCTFGKIVDGVVVALVGVCVDDCWLEGNRRTHCEWLLEFLIKKISSKNLGVCTLHDGCGVKRDMELCTLKIS